MENDLAITSHIRQSLLHEFPNEEVAFLEYLADKCNLKVLSLKTVISEIGVLNNYLSYTHPLHAKQGLSVRVKKVTDNEQSCHRHKEHRTTDEEHTEFLPAPFFTVKHCSHDTEHQVQPK
jgi:hypothetical protein